MYQSPTEAQLSNRQSEHIGTLVIFSSVVFERKV